MTTLLRLLKTELPHEPRLVDSVYETKLEGECKKLQVPQHLMAVEEADAEGQEKTSDEMAMVEGGEATQTRVRWAWVVCAAATLVQFVVLGIHNSFGVLFLALEREFHWKKALTGYIGSMGLGMNFFFGPIVSALCSRYGCRRVAVVGGLISTVAMLSTSFVDSLIPMYVTYSFLWGLGSSMCYVPTFLVINEYFPQRKALANGIITAGSAVGALILGPTMNSLLKSVGWRYTMRVLSGIACILFVAATTYSPLGESDSEKCRPAKKKKLFDFSVWRNHRFIVWAMALGLFNLGYFVPFVFLPTHATYLQIGDSQASFLIGFLSLGSLVGRLVFGHISDYRWVNRVYLNQTALLMMAVTTTMCPLATNYAGLVVYSVMFGLFDGCFVTLIAVITGDIVGCDKLAPALGFLYLVFSLPLMSGPLIAGFLIDITSSYHEAFYFSGATIAGCTCLLFVIPLVSSRRGDPSKAADEEAENKRQSVNPSASRTVVEYLVVVDRESCL